MPKIYKKTKKNPTLDEAEESGIKRMKCETERHHRSFLLYAMQSLASRKALPISRIMDVSHTAVQQWRKKYHWDARIKSQTIEVEAQQLYKAMYGGTYGLKEISQIEKNIATPVSASSPVPQSVADSVTDAIKQVQSQPKNVHEKEMKKKQMMILDAAIGYVAQGIKDQSIKRNIRDLPILIGLRNELASDGSKANAQNIVVESLRVRDAKANGTNIIEAMYEDAEELTLILKNLKGSNAVSEIQQQGN